MADSVGNHGSSARTVWDGLVVRRQAIDHRGELGPGLRSDFDSNSSPEALERPSREAHGYLVLQYKDMDA
jgi:hypothetical protein